MKYPGIFKIFFCKAAALEISELDVLDPDRAVRIYSQLTNIDFVGRPQIIENESDRNGRNFYSVELTFFSKKKYDFYKDCFVVQSVNKDYSLIGTADKPFTLVERHYSDGSTTALSGYTYKIKYDNVHGLVKALI